jgi:hypothetical protein
MTIVKAVVDTVIITWNEDRTKGECDYENSGDLMLLWKRWTVEITARVLYFSTICISTRRYTIPHTPNYYAN